MIGANDKVILDACCGGRCFWFDKKEPHTLFIDNRVREMGHDNHRKNHCIKPDLVADFRKMPFEDKRFKMVVFDPPHIIGKPDAYRMLKKYGWLNKETWETDIKLGFDECMRVLDDYGVLIFKWNETSIKRKKILEVIGKDVLFGHNTRSKNKTHWFCFMKFPEGDF